MNRYLGAANVTERSYVGSIDMSAEIVMHSPAIDIANSLSPEKRLSLFGLSVKLGQANQSPEVQAIQDAFEFIKKVLDIKLKQYPTQTGVMDNLSISQVEYKFQNTLNTNSDNKLLWADHSIMNGFMDGNTNEFGSDDYFGQTPPEGSEFMINHISIPASKTAEFIKNNPGNYTEASEGFLQIMDIYNPLYLADSDRSIEAARYMTKYFGSAEMIGYQQLFGSKSHAFGEYGTFDAGLGTVYASFTLGNDLTDFTQEMRRGGNGQTFQPAENLHVSNAFNSTAAYVNNERNIIVDHLDPNGGGGGAGFVRNIFKDGELVFSSQTQLK
ncbi:hypothetical protein COB57_06335 [Candidatus Peregrinibacteria bacterium]|nr:MAG: hypothetical protein COB57_06335 [Candidatus Peregrinibacteria bacterium]